MHHRPNILADDKRTECEDFARRYETGAPWDGITDAEAAERYGEIAPQLPRDVYESAAREAVMRLDSQQRMALGSYLHERAPEYGLRFPDTDTDAQDARLRDPDELARITSQLNEERPGVLAAILGSRPAPNGPGPGSLLRSPIAKALLGGIAAVAFRQLTGGR